MDGKKVKYTFKNWEHSYFLIHLMIPVRNIIPDFLYLLKIWDVMHLYYTLGDFLVIISSLSPLYKSILHRENTGLISWIFSTNSATKIYFSFLSSCHIKVNKHCPDWNFKKLFLQSWEFLKEKLKKHCLMTGR